MFLVGSPEFAKCLLLLLFQTTCRMFRSIHMLIRFSMCFSCLQHIYDFPTSCCFMASHILSFSLRYAWCSGFSNVIFLFRPSSQRFMAAKTKEVKCFDKEREVQDSGIAALADTIKILYEDIRRPENFFRRTRTRSEEKSTKHEKSTGACQQRSSVCICLS